VISIGGGKGGVGKSLVATNLAVAIAQTGREVVLCDLDLGAANLHLMLGATQARAGIQALLSPAGELEEALTPTRVPGLRLLAGTGGTVASANITHAQKLRIIRKLRTLKSDFVVIDVGAGVGYNALDFFELGQQRIIVATPQVTSMHDAYAFLKGAVLRTLKHHAGRSDEAWMLDPALSTRDGEKVKDLLLRVREQDPRFGEKIEKILKHFGAFLIGNQVESPGQVGVFQAVSRMVEDFLGISLPILGWIPHHGKLSDSINDRIPFMARADKAETREARAFRAVVEALLVGDMAPEEELLVELVEEGLKTEPVPEIDPASPELSPLLARPMPPPPPPMPPPAVEPAVQARPVPPPPPPPRRMTPPQVPESAAPAAAEEVVEEVSDLDSELPSDLPAVVMPRIYVRPPKRKRKVDPEEKKRRRALDAEGRRRKITLPGMPPTRVKGP
jgi:flagellar biosynthesis protein FlhG